MDKLDIQASQRIQFSLIAKFTQSEYTGTVFAVGTYALASQYADVDALHAQYIDSLPEGTEKDAKKLNYFIIHSSTNGEPKPFAFDWLENEVTVVENNVYSITLKSPLGASTTDIITRALNAYGLTDFQIEQV